MIRGAPANLERQPTRRLRAFTVERGKDRGDHGFVDEPNRLLPLDVDGIAVQWRADPEGAIRHIATLLGEPWASTSFVWFFSATHGLELDQDKRWTGRISDGKVRVRLVFITDRALTAAEADALTKIARVRMPQLDPCVIRAVQPNYIKRPLWMQHPHLDPLGDLPTIGRIKGKHEYLAVPNYLTEQARWAKAQGHDTDIADHDDAEAAVRGVASDGRIRSHLLSAVMHLLEANPAPEVVSFADHAINIVAKLQQMVAQHRSEIEANLSPYHRPWADVLQNLPDDMIRWAHWLLDHPNALRRKTIKLTKEQRAEADDAATREAIFERVARVIERVLHPDPFAASAARATDTPMVELLVAPTGSRKSTLMRAAAVRYVQEHPDKSVVFLVDRHKLGNEQIKDLRREHPDVEFRAAVWRGRHAPDPSAPDPLRPGKFLPMCRRSEEATKVEAALLNVDHYLCKQGRGDKAIKCRFFEECSYQAQKRIKANIWYAAHECMAHEMPKALGNVGLVMIDENPLGAFMFGIDVNDQVTLELDALQSEPQFVNRDYSREMLLGEARKQLYAGLHMLRVPIDRFKGVPASRQSLKDFMDEHHGGFTWLADYKADELYNLEWRSKVTADITPDMEEKEVREKCDKAASNRLVKKHVTLWELIEETNKSSQDELFGRIQVQRGDEGRIIRMVGLRPIATGWNVPTLICDATGDVELLKAIWPQITEEETHGWEQLPRPKSVRIFQCVDRSISKWAVAIEGNKKEAKRKEDAARRLYAALLTKAMQYGGARVAAIVYKSTEEWIRANCYVPSWLTLMHHGDVTGTNALQDVRALFVVGRILPPPESITMQTEALFGAYIPEREYEKDQGRIAIVPNAAGINTITVQVRRHPYALAERVRRQACEGALLQAIGRARAGLRGEDEPLDIHLWTDVPLPELGPVEPVLWSELEAGADGLMLAVGGVCLESIPDAVQAYPRLFTVDGLKSARHKGCFTNNTIISKTPSVVTVWYQKKGERQRPRRAVVLLGIDARAWLEEKLGPLSRCEEVATRQVRAQK